jgi:multidrug efflux pump subunit AcrB
MAAETSDSVFTKSYTGPIAWMARNHVAANLVMLIFVVGGFIASTRVKQEVMPEFATDIVLVSVPYPGASPAEVEQGIILSIEDQVRSVDGVKKVTSTARESHGSIVVELLTGADASKALQDVKNGVDSIQSFPEEAEKPVVSLIELRNQVVTLMVYGDQDEQTLRDLAEQIRDELLQRPDITLVELGAVRPLEIAIEVSQQNLRAHNLTLGRIAEEVREAAVELPAGGLKAAGGEILLRTQERRDFASEYANIPVASSPNGSRITVGDIATIKDGFEDWDFESYYNTQPAVQVNVFRVARETPQSVSASVHTYLEEIQPRLPDGIGLAVWNDSSEIYRDRMSLLLKNAFIGLCLVLLLLGLFLDPKLAFWVTLGIPISVMGAFLILPFSGASINMISLFAFIITLGIIVDDAVVVGENVYEKRQRGMPFLQAAIEGAQEIAGPVVFAVLTNIAAFLPLMFVPGVAGNFFRNIPAVTISVFIVSLIESLFILPAHLSHQDTPSRFWDLLNRPRLFFSRFLQTFIDRIYQPLVRAAISYRYATLMTGIAALILALGAVGGGHIQFSFMPRIDADIVTAQATLPFGVPLDTSRRVQQQMLEGLQVAIDTHGGPDIIRGTYTQIGAALRTGGAGEEAPKLSGSHLAGVQVALVPSDQRAVSSVEFSKTWRQATTHIVGLESLTFKAESGFSADGALDIQLTHRSRPILEAAAADLAEIFTGYAGVTDVDDGVSRGKPQLSLTVKPEARSLGINATDLARQLRGSFYGAEALRQQRGRNEVKVMVRLPEAERRTAHTIEQLIIRTEQGGEIPLLQAADVSYGRAYTEIRRRQGRRIMAVTADVDEEVSNANKIVAELEQNELPLLMQKYPGLNYALEGEQEWQKESLAAMGVGFIFALMTIYALLAIPFKSYMQPLIVMLSIPFGIIGAVIGHMLLGYELSLISMFGIIALAGVVINDALVLVVTANGFRDNQQMSPRDAIFHAGMRRFRPILLTSLTTFFGLMPMIFETSMQARFLIPMAISIGFGILFATGIILLIVPASYLILEDILGIPHLLRAGGHSEHRARQKPAVVPVSDLTSLEGSEERLQQPVPQPD